MKNILQPVFILLLLMAGTSFAADLITKPWKGDFDGMQERHVIRFLVVYGKTLYFVDKGEQKGISYDAGKLFEDEINKTWKDKVRKIHVAFVPVSREDLIPALMDGRGDIAAANLTITPERLKSVDFSNPLMANVSEILVTGPSAPAIKTVEDLAGKEIYVRTSSSYYESLTQLNEKFKKAGKPLMKLKPADSNLEDEDILEMVNGGLLPMMIIDSHKAEFWAQVLPDIKVRKDIALRTGGQIAWAFRKNSPKLTEVVNAFVNSNKKGTMIGNMIFQRYLKNTKYVKNATTQEEMKKFQVMVELFKKYAGQYGFDWMMMAAQGYQESRLDQSTRSHVGAIGVMQVMPTTAKDPNVNIPNIEQLEPNINAGIKYMRFMMNQYFKDAQMDVINKGLFAFASYNAGPNRIARLRKQAAAEGLNPNLWFNNVELIVAREVGRETVQYVGNIYKYYVAYTLVMEQHNEKEAAKKAIGK
jgi:membrane-bound lytic murein transglycosylase MltF